MFYGRKQLDCAISATSRKAEANRKAVAIKQGVGNDAYDWGDLVRNARLASFTSRAELTSALACLQDP